MCRQRAIITQYPILDTSHYVGGGFERLDTALDDLKAREYNAVRIDTLPHLVAADGRGDVAERFLDVPGVSFHKYGIAQ